MAASPAHASRLPTTNPRSSSSSSHAQQLPAFDNPEAKLRYQVYRSEYLRYEAYRLADYGSIRTCSYPLLNWVSQCLQPSCSHNLPCNNTVPGQSLCYTHCLHSACTCLQAHCCKQSGGENNQRVFHLPAFLQPLAIHICGHRRELPHSRDCGCGRAVRWEVQPAGGIFGGASAQALLCTEDSLPCRFKPLPMCRMCAVMLCSCLHRHMMLTYEQGFKLWSN